VLKRSLFCIYSYRHYDCLLFSQLVSSFCRCTLGWAFHMARATASREEEHKRRLSASSNASGFSLAMYMHDSFFQQEHQQSQATACTWTFLSTSALRRCSRRVFQESDPKMISLFVVSKLFDGLKEPKKLPRTHALVECKQVCCQIRNRCERSTTFALTHIRLAIPCAKRNLAFQR